MITKIANGIILQNGKALCGKNVYIKDGVILDVTSNDLPFDNLIDAKGNYVSAGFIELHVHGGNGFDFMDGGIEPIINAVDFHLSHGTTSIMPTSLASSVETLKQFLSDLKIVVDQKLTKANVLGAHLEGPYFALAQRGAQNPDYITDPIKEDYDAIIKEFKQLIRRWDFAPEREGSAEFCKTLIENDITPAIAHSDATLEEIIPVYELGCHLVTHLYSGMSSIVRKGGYRVLGVVESTYLLDNMIAEVIADGDHLPPELLKLIIKQLGIENICAITDAVRGAGQPEGESFIGRKGEETPCIIENGIAKMPDHSGFAGSVATSDRLLRTLVFKAGLPIEQAILALTANPAKLFNLKTKGNISVGLDADIVIFDHDINVLSVIVAGNLI